MNYIIIITFCVSLFVLYTFHRKYSEKIFMSDDADITVCIRREYSYIRYFIGIMTGAVIFIIMFFDDFHLNSITIGLGVFWSGYLMRTALPVSNKRPNDIPQEEKFILYLRGFSYDKYEGVQTYQRQTRFEKFSEFHFVNILNKFFPVYSVGMTKELSSPLGATRIYLNDREWEKEVQMLIDRAELIIVLVNDSDSCLWELEHCYDLHKTILIVDDKEKMITVRGHFAKNHLYPFPISISPQTLFLYDEQNNLSTFAYENKEKSYRKIIKQFMKKRYGMRRWIISSWQERLFIVLAIIISFPLLFIMTMVKISNGELMMYLIITVFIIIILYMLYSIPMSKWRKIEAK